MRRTQRRKPQQQQALQTPQPPSLPQQTSSSATNKLSEEDDRIMTEGMLLPSRGVVAGSNTTTNISSSSGHVVNLSAAKAAAAVALPPSSASTENILKGTLHSTTGGNIPLYQDPTDSSVHGGRLFGPSAPPNTNTNTATTTTTTASNTAIDGMMGVQHHSSRRSSAPIIPVTSSSATKSMSMISGSSSGMGMVGHHLPSESGSGIAASSSSITPTPPPGAGAATSAAGTSSGETAGPGRVEFCPYQHDWYGCINCLPHDDATDHSHHHHHHQHTTTTTKSTRLKKNKLAPVLLEIRHLQLIKNELKRRDGRLFRSVVLGTSRGILKSSSISTCLSFRPEARIHSRTDSSSSSSNGNGVDRVVQVATGLTTGALCIHSIPILAAAADNDNNIATNSDRDGESSSSLPSGSVSYYAARHSRPATCVAWRPKDTRHVAIGLKSYRRGGRGDLQFGCLIWDVDVHSKAMGGKGAGAGGDGGGNPHAIKVPSYRFAHDCGVTSLAWLSSTGQTLLVGCQIRNLHLYDLRTSGTNVQPSSVIAHTDSVNGVEVDPFRPHYFATFSKGINEPVKLWDARRMDKAYVEIKTSGFSSGSSGNGGYNEDHHGGGNSMSASGTVVSAIAWSAIHPGTLAVAVNDTIRNFATVSMGVDSATNANTTTATRPVLVRKSYAPNGIQSLAFPHPHNDAGAAISNDGRMKKKEEEEDRFFPHRMLTVSLDGQVHYLPKFQIAPVAISRRDRRIVHSSGGTVWMGSTFEGASAMEIIDKIQNEDVSATMMRRARCLYATRYSTDASANLQILSEELSCEEDFLNHDSLHENEDTTTTTMMTATDGNYAATNANANNNDGNNNNNSIGNTSIHTMGEGGMNFLSSTREALWRLWSWIERVELLSQHHQQDSTNDGGSGGILDTNEISWPAKGLIDGGVFRLLRMDEVNPNNHDGRGGGGGGGFDYQTRDAVHFSNSLQCNTYDSAIRRIALASCGWTGKFGLREVLDVCEANGNFERSAALAVFHGELGAAVAALQRGADAIRLKYGGGGRSSPNDEEYYQQQQQQHHQEHGGGGDANGGGFVSNPYAEALQLVAMCIAGYRGNDTGNSSNSGTNASGSAWNSSNVWRNACEGLLRRPELLPTTHHKQSNNKGNDNNGGGGIRRKHVPYLRSACVFLCNIGRGDGFEKILNDKALSLCDRVAFACRFLPRKDLRLYLQRCVKDCLALGNLEGMLITGLDRKGIALLQSYVDRYADVQTAALVSSRVILPTAWVQERIVCSEWLDSYRDLLNTWQMWQSRAMFDVGRADLLRRLKSRQQQPDELGGIGGSGGGIGGGGRSLTQQSRRTGYGHSSFSQQQQQPQSQGNRKQPQGMQNKQISSNNEDLTFTLPNFPPQLYARCNFCNTSLPLSKLRRQKGMGSNWLSRQKPVLNCCPSCKKPLPRCAICLLPLGCLNPYLELKRERGDRINNLLPSSCKTSAGSAMDDCLSGLANLPFAEWFTWCMKCKHGGHAHHMVGWFAKHETCAVSGCDCRCQFDGIQKLKRPAISSNEKEEGDVG